MTLQRLLADLSEDVTRSSEIFNKCVYCSLDTDEPITQMPVFARGVTSDTKAVEQLVHLSPMQGQTKR